MNTEQRMLSSKQLFMGSSTIFTDILKIMQFMIRLSSLHTRSMDQHISGDDNWIGKNLEISIRSLNFLPQLNGVLWCQSTSLEFPLVVCQLENLAEKHCK